MNLDQFLEQYGFQRKEHFVDNSDFFVKRGCRLHVRKKDENLRVFMTDDENYELVTFIDETNYEEKLHELFKKANDILFEKLIDTLNNLHTFPLTIDQIAEKGNLLEQLREIHKP